MVPVHNGDDESQVGSIAADCSSTEKPSELQIVPAIVWFWKTASKPFNRIFAQVTWLMMSVAVPVLHVEGGFCRKKSQLSLQQIVTWERTILELLMGSLSTRWLCWHFSTPPKRTQYSLDTFCCFGIKHSIACLRLGTISPCYLFCSTRNGSHSWTRQGGQFLSNGPKRCHSDKRCTTYIFHNNLIYGYICTELPTPWHIALLYE